jgi:hypothetical protein
MRGRLLIHTDLMCNFLIVMARLSPDRHIVTINHSPLRFSIREKPRYVDGLEFSASKLRHCNGPDLTLY